jgi:hypothetical protein
MRDTVEIFLLESVGAAACGGPARRTCILDFWSPRPRNHAVLSSDLDALLGPRVRVREFFKPPQSRARDLEIKTGRTSNPLNPA